MNNYYLQQYLDKYNEFLDQLIKLYHNNESILVHLTTIKNNTDEFKFAKGKDFNSLINSKTKNQNLFLKKKIKMFSTKNKDSIKISFSLLGNKISIKQILNKKTDDIRIILWNYLYLLYLLMELSDKQPNNELTSKIIYALNYKPSETNTSTNETTTVENVDVANADVDVANGENVDVANADVKMVKNKILGINIDSKTNNMLDDIVKSFDKHLDKSNPFQSIMDVTNDITVKYKDKIDNGEINLDGIFNDLQSKLPGLDMAQMLKGTQKKKKTHIIDKNFSTADVDVGNIDNNSGLNIGNMLNMFKDVDLNSLMNMKIPNNETEAAELKNNMDKMMKSMNLDVNDIMKNLK